MTATSSNTPDISKQTDPAITKIKDRAKAKATFQALVQQEPTNETAWFHLAGLADNAAEAYTALNVVKKLNPEHPYIPKVQAWINQQWPNQVSSLEEEAQQPLPGRHGDGYGGSRHRADHSCGESEPREA